MTYDCTNVVGPYGINYTTKLCGTGNPLGKMDGIFDGDSSDGVLNLYATVADYTGYQLLAGDYTFTITATDAAGNQVTTTFGWTLIDPCNPVDALSVASLPNLTYAILQT